MKKEPCVICRKPANYAEKHEGWECSHVDCPNRKQTMSTECYDINTQHHVSINGLATGDGLYRGKARIAE